jgi:DNA-binding LacI/PurR family transcriptional regulator
MSVRKPRIAMKDIAAELGISKNAVSLALGNKPGVSQELRERVFEVAARVGYHGHADTRMVGSRKLLIISPEVYVEDRFFYSDIYLGIQKQAQVTGHFTMLSGLTQKMFQENILPDVITDYEFDGILTVGVIPHDYLQLIFERNIPTVTVDNYYDDLPVNTVVTANEEGAYTVTKHLIELGHRDIGFIAPIENSASFFERWQGYVKAMVYSKLPVGDEFSIKESWSLSSLGKNPEDVRKAIAALPRLPSAFVCGNDEIAISVMNVLREMGNSVPGDISVTGFDDIDAARFYVPALTTYQVPRVQLGQEAVRFLLSIIADKKRGHVVTKRSLYGALQVRESTAQVKR